MTVRMHKKFFALPVRNGTKAFVSILQCVLMTVIITFGHECTQGMSSDIDAFAEANSFENHVDKKPDTQFWQCARFWNDN
jgi:hypothetical protein